MPPRRKHYNKPTQNELQFVERLGTFVDPIYKHTELVERDQQVYRLRLLRNYRLLMTGRSWEPGVDAEVVKKRVEKLIRELNEKVFGPHNSAANSMAKADP